MKKFLLTIMLQCFALLFLIFGCGGAQIDGEGSGHEPSSALNDSGLCTPRRRLRKKYFTALLILFPFQAWMSLFPISTQRKKVKI